MEKLVLERIEENKKLFSKEEFEKINNNYCLIEKIYLIGLIDGQS